MCNANLYFIFIELSYQHTRSIYLPFSRSFVLEIFDLFSAALIHDFLIRFFSIIVIVVVARRRVVAQVKWKVASVWFDCGSISMIQNDYGGHETGDFWCNSAKEQEQEICRAMKGMTFWVGLRLYIYYRRMYKYNNRGPYQLAGIIECMRRDHWVNSQKARFHRSTSKCDHDVSANAGRFMCIRYEHKIKWWWLPALM